MILLDSLKPKGGIRSSLRSLLALSIILVYSYVKFKNKIKLNK